MGLILGVREIQEQGDVGDLDLLGQRPLDQWDGIGEAQRFYAQGGVEVGQHQFAIHRDRLGARGFRREEFPLNAKAQMSRVRSGKRQDGKRSGAGGFGPNL